eukprot:jgi/Mesvir1/29179/Mv25947-RA.3
MELMSANICASKVTVGKAGVEFTGDMAVGYRANLWLRSAVRVLLLLSEGPLDPSQEGGDSVYEFVKSSVDWPQLLHDGRAMRSRGEAPLLTFSVDARVALCSTFNNSHMASTRAKDAICDALRDATGSKPPKPQSTREADVPLFLSLFKDNALLYRDMSGQSLHKRGYRSVMHKASLNEAIAAAMLQWAGWCPSMGHAAGASGGAVAGAAGVTAAPHVLCDPMCGSGTILLEAALMACNVAPGILRDGGDWPLLSWPDTDRSVWSQCVAETHAAAVAADSDVLLMGNDIHDGALSLCKRDATLLAELMPPHVRPPRLRLSHETCGAYKPLQTPQLVVVNPPWGGRLLKGSSEEAALEETWLELGDFLKESCRRADVFVLSGNAQVTRGLRMKAEKKYPVVVGGVDCRVMHYKVLPPKPASDPVVHSQQDNNGSKAGRLSP